MVETRISRAAVEVLADEGAVAGVNRLTTQVLAVGDQSNSIGVSRVAVEVLAVEPDVGAVNRLTTQVLAVGDQSAPIGVSRVAIEVLAGPDAACAVNWLTTQVLAAGDSPAPVGISRVSVECLARQGSAGTVIPLALADDAYLFLHNWASKAVMRTSFRTAVATSPTSGAESRRGLNVKPYRVLDLEWTVCDPTTTTGINSLIELERLEVALRRMTNARFQMPIYMDQVELPVSYITTDTTILIPTREGRFFPGQRVAIVQLDACNQPVSHTWHIIEDMANDSLTFDAALGVNVAAGSLVFPVMDCEVELEVTARYSTARVPTLKMTVSEAPGASQLPPLKSDTPTGAENFEDRPIWAEEPDWTKPLKKGRERAGSRTNEGRADFVSSEGDRSRQTHQFDINGTRADMWNCLEFFETRRGRLRSFWHIDQDQYMEIIAIDAAGADVSISENDLDLADTQEEFTHVGLVMSDGMVYVRDVSQIQAILTVFQIDLITSLPAGLLFTDVHRIARARLTRFVKDEFVETWLHTGYMSAKIDIIEVINEADFPAI
jgi:hypothetical protein